MRRNRWLRVFSLMLLMALPLLLTGCDSVLMDPKGQVGEAERRLILTAFGLMLIVVIPVIVMTLLFARRYRRGNKEAGYSPDWAHSNVIEVIVWFIPCVIIVFLAVLTWHTSHSLDPHKPLDPDDGTEPMVIQAVSLDWKWLFIYPEQGIATVNEVVFPVDVPVHFRVTSGSVMNSFMIPRLGSQIYAMAGMDNDVHLIADEQGTYWGRSTNYSGAGFSEMIFEARATSRQDFDAWVEKVQGSSDTLAFPDGYQALAEPSVDHPVEYFSNVSPNLYGKIIQSFHDGSGMSDHVSHAGGPGEHDGGLQELPMSAEAAE